jgi:dephospho-CoA kinase
MINLPLKIGITGGIGSGKSTVTKVFSSLGIPVYDSDSRAKWLMNHDPELRTKILQHFGPETYINGILNREYLGKLVFPNPEKVALLNQLVHPAVGRDSIQWIKEHGESPYVIKEAALLIESGAYKQLDKLILVSAPEEIRIQRVLSRDPHRSLEDVKNVMNRQLSEEEMKKYCQYVLLNDGITPILPMILALDEEFKSM